MLIHINNGYDDYDDGDDNYLFKLNFFLSFFIFLTNNYSVNY